MLDDLPNGAVLHKTKPRSLRHILRHAACPAAGSITRLVKKLRRQVHRLQLAANGRRVAKSFRTAQITTGSRSPCPPSSTNSSPPPKRRPTYGELVALTAGLLGPPAAQCR